MAGLVAALPIVGGPILLFYAWDHGARFVARAAEQTLSGILSLSAFCVAYAWIATFQRSYTAERAALALLASWAVFLVCTAVLAVLAPPGFISASLAGMGLLLGGRSLPRINARKTGADAVGAAWDRPRRGRLRSRELGVRMAATAALVVTLTSVGGWLGPVLSGLLTPFPVASTVPLVSAHRTGGPPAAVLMLRGFLAGMWGFVWFCVAIAWAAVPLGPWAGFGLGCLGVAAVQGWIAAVRGKREADA